MVSRRRILLAALASMLPALWAAPGAAQTTASALERIGGPFTLTDQFGETRRDEDFRGRFMLIFFGYANCRSICPVGLRHMTAALDKLSDKKKARIQPILITVDPQNDTPESMSRTLPKIHPRLLGLTGSPARLAEVYRAYQIESKQVAKTADGEPIFAHGSFIYLMRPDGGFATMMPPVLDEQRIVKILRRYVS